jgi:hypothetical protein
MSATPRPWHDDGYRVYGPTTESDPRSGPVIFEYKHVDPQNPDDYQFILRAVNAFDALLDVAKAAIESGDEDVVAALSALEAAYPGWQEWS